jgi:hypothetical protein
LGLSLFCVEFLEALLKSCDHFKLVDELAEFCRVKVGEIEENNEDLESIVDILGVAESVRFVH